MIKVFPSVLEGEPCEVHHTLQPMTLRAWLTANAPKLCLENPPIAVTVNGAPASIDCEFQPADEVHIQVLPRASGAIGAIVAAVVAVAVSLLMRPNMPKQREQLQGQGLKSASLTGNMPRYGDPIPEVAGLPPRIYGDLLVPTRTYYSSPTVQWVEAFLCVGKGEFQKSVNDVFIGDTRAPALGNDVELRFYEPGEDVSGESAADWWHTPVEVGFTSRGNSGMELGTESGRTPSVDASAFTVNGNILSIAAGGPFPDDWISGISLRVEVPYPATVLPGLRDVIESEFAFSHFTPSAGMQVSLGGDANGTFLVDSYAPPTGVTPPVPGSPSTVTGNAAPSRLDFGQSPDSFSVALEGATYTVYLSTNYADVAGLVAAINAQLNSTRVVASDQMGRIQISERSSPYSGAMIFLSGPAVPDIFGSAPDSAPGIKTEPEKPAGAGRLTLSTLDGLPVADLPKGQIQLAVGPNDFTYQVAARLNDLALELTGPDWHPTTSPDISVALAADSQVVGWTGPFAVTPDGEDCTAFEIDYTFPNGLIHYNKKGRWERIDATVFVEWREVGSTGAWQSQQYDHRLAEADGLGFTQRIELDPPARVEVRLRRSPKLNWQNTSEDIQWTGLRGKMLNRPARYEGVTTLSVKLRTGDRVSSQADNKIWLRATRILPLFDGTSAPTRDIAPFLLHMFRTCGYEGFVDIEALEELHDIWSARQDYFDISQDKHSTVKRMAADVLRAGFADLTIENGLLTPVRDARTDITNYIYSPQEFVQYPVLSTTMVAPDDIDGVDAEYVDELTGQTETIKYRLLGDEGRRAEKIQLPGVTNWTKAWRLAARHRRVLAYRRTTFKGTTELHALNSRYMSKDLIQDGIPEFGQSCFAVSLDGLVLEVSEPLDWGADQNRVIGLRQLDGKVTPPVWVKRGPTDYHLELLEPLPWSFQWSFGGVANTDPTMVYFGSVRKWSHEVLITKISPRQDSTVDIEAVQYDDRVYADDDRDPASEVYLTSGVYEAEEHTSEVYAATDATSTLYPIEFDDSLGVSVVKPLAGPIITWPVDRMQVSFVAPSISRSTVVRYLTYDKAEPESLGVAILAPSVQRIQQVIPDHHEYAAEPESIAVTMLPPAVFRQKVADYLEYTIPEESLAVTMLAPSVSIEFGVDIWEAPTNLKGVFEDG